MRIGIQKADTPWRALRLSLVWIARMLEKNGLDHDPLTTHGTTLGKRWAEGRY